METVQCSKEGMSSTLWTLIKVERRRKNIGRKKKCLPSTSGICILPGMQPGLLMANDVIDQTYYVVARPTLSSDVSRIFRIFQFSSVSLITLIFRIYTHKYRNWFLVHHHQYILSSFSGTSSSIFDCSTYYRNTKFSGELALIVQTLSGIVGTM